MNDDEALLREISERLRLLARDVFDCNYRGTHGICWALNPHGVVYKYRLSGRAYTKLCVLMHEHKPRWGGFLCAKGLRWEQRAMFCLLLAESIDKGAWS